MPASAACQDPWRRANTLHTFWPPLRCLTQSLRCWGFAKRAAPRGPRAQRRLLVFSMDFVSQRDDRATGLHL